MKITIENTTKFTHLNGVKMRIWEGQTATGIKVHCFIARVAIHKDDEPRAEEFKKELQEEKAPSVEIEAMPLRLII